MTETETINETITIILKHKTPRHGKVWENETHQVIRYLNELNDTITKKINTNVTQTQHNTKPTLQPPPAKTQTMPLAPIC